MNHQSLNTDHLMIRMEHMEMLLMENLKNIGKSIDKLAQGGCAHAPAAAPQEPCGAQSWQTLSARLAMLEEGFGRICNTMGRLDQEFQILKQTIEQGGK